MLLVGGPVAKSKRPNEAAVLLWGWYFLLCMVYCGVVVLCVVVGGIVCICAVLVGVILWTPAPLSSCGAELRQVRYGALLLVLLLVLFTYPCIPSRLYENDASYLLALM